MTAPRLINFVQGQTVLTGDEANTFAMTCDTVAQMRAFPGVAGKQIYMRGYLAAADGGQGNFYWSSASTAVDDGGVSAIKPTGASGAGRWLRIPNVNAASNTVANVQAFGATGAGSPTNDRAAIMAAIASLAGTGGTVYFPSGSYYIGSGAGLVVTGNGVTLAGAAAPCAGESPYIGAEITYDGTGAAVTFGQASASIFRSGLSSLQIRAIGAGQASATAIGLVLNNAQNCVVDQVSANGFTAGVGMVSQANGATFYSANNVLISPTIWGNLVGLRSTATGGGVGDNTLQTFGGYVIGLGASGIGVDIQAAGNSHVFNGTDVESALVGWKVAGTDCRFMATRSEACATHIAVQAAGSHNMFIGHAPNTPGGETVYTDAGADNHYWGSAAGGTANFIGKHLFQPPADSSEILAVADAAGATFFDVSSNGTKRVELARGALMQFWSDIFVTLKAFIHASDGSASFSTAATAVTTVALLPAAASNQRAMVSDANATTFNSVVAGGGANKVPVFSDGAAWRIG